MGSGIRRAVTLAGFAIAALALASCGDDKTAGDERTLTYFLTYFEGPYFEPQAGEEPPGYARPGRVPQPGVVAIAGTLGESVAIAGTLGDGDGNAVGDVNGFCIVNRVTEGDRHACSGIVDLPEGQLNIAYGGDITGGPQGVTGSITGGTGDYEGATGSYEVVFEEGPTRAPKQIFTFTLP